MAAEVAAGRDALAAIMGNALWSHRIALTVAPISGTGLWFDETGGPGVAPVLATVESGGGFMALTARQKAENRKDIAAGKSPRNKSTALTATDASTVDGTYGAEEQAVVGNSRTRSGEVQTALQDFGILA